MNVNLELYRIFYVVAKHKHMTQASEELHISQPAISQSIKKLEDELGGTLFLRSNKGMELTEEGKMFYEYVKGALELINNAENEFTSYKDLSKGEIKNGLTSDLIQDLKVGKLDFVIFNESNIKEKNVCLKKIKNLKQGFIYNKDYFKDNNFSFDELNNYPLILQKEESNSRKLLNYIASTYNVSLIPKMEVVSQELITEFVHIGLGVGFCIIDLAKRNYPYLEELSVNKKIPDISVYLATNKSILLTFASKKFIEYLSNEN